MRFKLDLYSSRYWVRRYILRSWPYGILRFIELISVTILFISPHSTNHWSFVCNARSRLISFIHLPRDDTGFNPRSSIPSVLPSLPFHKISIQQLPTTVKNREYLKDAEKPYRSVIMFCHRTWTHPVELPRDPSRKLYELEGKPSRRKGCVWCGKFPFGLISDSQWTSADYASSHFHVPRPNKKPSYRNGDKFVRFDPYANPYKRWIW